MKYKIDYPDTERGNELKFERIEIVMDPDDSLRVWIYMLNEDGERIEGGSFGYAEFMHTIAKFYNENY
jgi:hypothetical protein